MPKCNDCNGPLPAGRVCGDCETCKAERRRLAALHAWAKPCRADQQGKAARVARYAATIAKGQRIFESGRVE